MLPTVPSAIAGIVREMCRPVLAGTPIVGGRAFSEVERREFVANFSDEKGHRREIDPVLLEWVMRGAGGEEGMLERWWGVVGGKKSEKRKAESENDEESGHGLEARATRNSLEVERLMEGGGGLVPWLFERGIEIWTEGELCALHLLGHLAARDARYAARLERAALWAMAELQPDNGTNHPWAFHVFARRWCERGEHEARMYAEALLHNCVVQMGRVDRFSAVILWDSARAMEA